MAPTTVTVISVLEYCCVHTATWCIAVYRLTAAMTQVIELCSLSPRCMMRILRRPAVVPAIPLLQVQDAHDVDFELLQLQSRVSLSWREGHDGMEAAGDAVVGQPGAGQLSRLLHTAGGCLHKACWCRLCFIMVPLSDVQGLLPQAMLPVMQSSMQWGSSTLQRAPRCRQALSWRPPTMPVPLSGSGEGVSAFQQASCLLRCILVAQEHCVTLCM